MKGVLDGIRVLDVSHRISGPFCTKLLASLGAEVIKVERPGEGDPSRRSGPFPGDVPHPEKSGLFLYLNTNKESVTLNLESHSGRKIFRELAKTADVVVENFEPGVMRALEVSYEDLEKINPRLVMVSISNFGQDGSYSQLKAEDINIWAMSGQMYSFGHPEREPLQYSVAIGQYYAGSFAFTGAMAALLYAAETGTGQHVDISIMECLARIDNPSIEKYMVKGEVEGRREVPLFLPCKDGWIYFIGWPHEWHRFAEFFNMLGIASDSRFKTRQQRARHPEELNLLLLPYTIEREKIKLYHETQSVKVTGAYMATVEDALESPQHKERGVFAEVDHPVAGKLVQPASVLRMGELPRVENHAPLLGEHNEKIYCSYLGYSHEDLVKLRQAGII